MRHEGKKRERIAIPPMDILAKPNSLMIGKLSSLLRWKISLAVKAGLVACRNPAMNRRTPTGQNTNHLPIRGQASVTSCPLHCMMMHRMGKSTMNSRMLTR